MPSRCSTPSAVLALPCGSRSITRVVQPLQREGRRDVDGGRRLADAALLVGDGEDALACRAGQSALGGGVQEPHGALGLGADRGVDAGLCRSTCPSGGGGLVHVSRETSGRARSPSSRRSSAGTAGAAPLPSGTELIPVSCPLTGRSVRTSAVAPRRRSRVDPSSPRHISSPLHRPHRATPSHAGARGPRPRRARP